MKSFTVKQLTAIRAGTYGQQTKMIHQLVETALDASNQLTEAADDARRLAERLSEYTELRPEHERVLIVMTRPLGETGLPAIEVYSDARVKLKIMFEYEKLPIIWEPMLDQYAEIQVIPNWLFELPATL